MRCEAELQGWVYFCHEWEVTTSAPMGGHDFSRAVKDDKQRGFSPLRYLRSSGSARFRSSWEGTTSVVPLITNKQRGFSPCGTGRSRCLAVLWDTWGPMFPVGGHDFSRAVKDDKQQGFSPCGTCGLQAAHDFRSSWEGTTLVVPLRTKKPEGLQPQRYLQVPMSHETWGSTSPIPLH